MPIATPQGTLDFKSVDKVTFVGASSNTVIDTTTGSLGVGVGVGGPTSNLHVVGNTRLEGDINMLHTSNTASIKLNSNVVAEFPRSKKLIKYPRVLLTSETSGGYIVTSSEEISGGGSASWQNWKPFGGFFPSNNNAWLTGSDSYPSTAGAASTSGTTEGFTLPQNLGTDSGGSATANGSWLKLQLPHKITLQYIRMNGNDVVAPDDFDVLGSNDDTNWNVLGGFTTPNPSLFNRMDQFDISATTSYLYYAVIIKSHRGTNHPYSGIYNLEYYGTPEYDPEAHGTDVTVKSYPNVPNTDWLEVYYDAKGLATMPSTVTDLAGGDQDASVYGVTLDTTNEAFVFNGSSYLETNIPQITTGVWPFTMSFWFKVNAHIGTTWNYLAHLGIRGTNGDSTLVGLQNDQISITTWGDSKINSGVVATPGVWYHVTSTWPGGAFYDNAKLYINAVSYGDIANTRVETSPLSFPTSGNKLTLGKQMNTTSDYFNGSIANFRLFNRALTSDEIYQLYAYQKEDFGHGDLSMTLKAGRLGIGTSEPQAALDVRGRIMREYYPGEVIEELHAVCASTSLRGKAVMQNVTAYQALTTSYADVSGSRLEDYIIPKGTKNIVYEYSFHTKFEDAHSISHWKLFYKVGGGTWNEVTHARMDVSSQYYDMRQLCRWVFEVGADSETASIGKLTAKAGDSFHVRWQVREYHSSHEMSLHLTQYWDGGGGDQFSRPLVMIKAIA
jgi:hypothetical protein